MCVIRMSFGCPFAWVQRLAAWSARFFPSAPIRVHDLALDITLSVRLHGKGRKAYLAALEGTAMEIRQVPGLLGLQKNQALRPNRWELS